MSAKNPILWCAGTAMLCLAVFCAAPAAAAASKLPEWVSAAAALPTGSSPDGTSAVMLSEDVSLVVAPNGTKTRRTRVAIRILTSDGRKHASAHAYYNKASGRLVSLQAWAVRPGGKVTEFGKKHIIQAASYPSSLELYGDYWKAAIFAGDDAQSGGTFAYESVTEQRDVFAQEVFGFQWTIPAIRSSFGVSVPKGWKVDGRIFNGGEVEPVVTESRTSWTIENLPAWVAEPLSASSRSSGPWLAVDIRRPEGTAGTFMSWSFESWRSVSEHFTPLYDTASAPDDAVRARAASLTNDLAPGWERIRALCSYAQSINYISIDLNTSAGGGMIPRPARQVLACGYGDCKDKSALLLSLLAAQGIRAHAAIVFSGDSRRIQDSWPSPHQFNHCIVAIPVDESVTGPAVVMHPTLGRLLFFDPTNSNAPAGILPAEDQGSLALVLAGSAGELIRLPEASPEDNHVERRIRATLDGSGTLRGTIREEFRGNASVVSRAEVRENSPTSFRELIERWLSATLPAARATRAAPVDDFARAALDLEIDFEAPGHGRLMRKTLMVFKPVLVGRRGSSLLRPGERRNAVVFEAFSLSETTEFELPEGFRIDEIVEPVEIESSFGRYTARGRLAEDGKLIFERTLRIQPAVVPPSDYAGVRTFYERIIQTEQSPVVLARLPAP